MKGNKKILVIAVLLLLIAVSYTTYAIYKTAVAGNSEVTAAKWEVEFKDGQNTITETQNITLTCENNAHVKDGKIAPGASCTKTIILDAGQTEVDVTYTATAGDPLNGNSAVDTDANDFTVSLTPASGTIGYNDATRTKELTLTVAWGGTDDSDAQTDPDKINDADTGLQGETITVPVTLVAKQVVGS